VYSKSADFLWAIAITMRQVHVVCVMFCIFTLWDSLVCFCFVLFLVSVCFLLLLFVCFLLFVCLFVLFFSEFGHALCLFSGSWKYIWLSVPINTLYQQTFSNQTVTDNHSFQKTKLQWTPVYTGKRQSTHTPSI